MKQATKGGGMESSSLSARTRPRPQYNYFYGSTTDTAADALTVATNDTESLVGEILVPTDNEEEAPNSNGHDVQHLLMSNGQSTKSWLPGSRSGEKNGIGRVLAILLLAASVSTFFILLMPHSSRPIPEAQSIFVPFEKANRADYGDPVDGLLDLNLFHPSLLSDDAQRTFNFPFPTGAFWTNLVVPSPDAQYSYPTVVYPYAYKWSETSLQLSYPAAHRLEDKNHRWVTDTFAPELTMYTAEAAKSRFITKYDPLSVTVRFFATTESKWETTLVQGSPYTTIKYLKGTPIFKALSTFKAVQCPGDEAEDFHDFFEDDQEEDADRRRLFGVCSIEDDSDKTTMRGVQFMFSSEEGAYWILFSSEPISLEYDKIHKTTITSSSPFTGILRIAYIPAVDASDTSSFSSTGLRRLIYHAGVYPTAGEVSWEFHSQATASKTKKTNVTTSSRHATVHFSFEARSMTDDSIRPKNMPIGLLMLALPHHLQVLPQSVQLSKTRFDLTYNCIKGPLTPIVGSVWSFEEPLLDLNFDAPTQDLDPGVRRTILDQVEKDVARVLPTNDENVYGYGKQVARLAQLVHIANELQIGHTLQKGAEEEGSSLVQKGKELLGFYLENFLTNQVADFLLFDVNMGGIVSKNGLMDKSADFGNGRYNDHHFHYGYILYASAILARLDATFVDRFGGHVDALFHDVAHSANGDSKTVLPNSAFFPMSRHKSWFDGHSFATGMFPFGNGKSQESSSEAVNCYYGAYLWSLVRHGDGSVGSDLTDFARLLFAMEVRGAQTYWHMMPKGALEDNSKAVQVYSTTFQRNYMVGNVGMLDVSANTWFGNDALYVHMINAIPITSATAVLFDSKYVQQEYKYLMASRSEVEMPWRGYTVSIHAIIDPNMAWEDAQGLVSYELDAAISKSQVLYWIMSRPNFNVTVSVENGGPASTDDSASDTGASSAACNNHSRCEKLGISGQCCPTSDGSYLGCCGGSDAGGKSQVLATNSSEKSKASSSDDSSLCENNPGCVEAGLSGVCCPTNEKVPVMLGCCA